MVKIDDSKLEKELDAFLSASYSKMSDSALMEKCTILICLLH